MNDKAAQKYLEPWKFSGTPITEFDLALLVKEVERDTRHKCAELVSKLGNDVFNLEWPE